MEMLFRTLLAKATTPPVHNTYSIFPQAKDTGAGQNGLVHEVEIVRDEHQRQQSPINLAQDKFGHVVVIFIDSRGLRGRLFAHSALSL